jgi:hypothetical protein
VDRRQNEEVLVEMGRPGQIRAGAGWVDHEL